MFSDHNIIKLEKNNKKITGKSPRTWQLNYTLENNPCFKGKSLKGNKKQQH